MTWSLDVTVSSNEDDKEETLTDIKLSCLSKLLASKFFDDESKFSFFDSKAPF